MLAVIHRLSLKTRLLTFPTVSIAGVCVRVKLVFVFFTGLFSIFVSFSVSLDKLWFYVVIVVAFSFFRYRSKRLAGKNISEMTYFVLSGTLNLAPSIFRHSSFSAADSCVGNALPPYLRQDMNHRTIDISFSY